MRSQGAEDHEVRRPDAPEKDTAPRPCLIARVPIIRIRDGESLQLTDSVARESSLVLLVNGRVLCRLQCSPAQLEELALGFLYTAGLLPPQARDVPTTCEVRETETLVDVQLDIPDEDVARLRESLVAGTGCGLGLFAAKGLDPLDCGRKIDTSFRVKAVELSDAMQAFQKSSAVYRETGGVHSAAIADGGKLVAFAEDVGRHNAVDKVIGCCLRRGQPLHDKIVLTTGRLSLDLVAKSVRVGLPVAASRSAPTDAAVELARLANLTLAGFVRGGRMNIYTAEWRIE